MRAPPGTTPRFLVRGGASAPAWAFILFMGVGSRRAADQFIIESQALLSTSQGMRDLALGVCTGCAVVVGGLYVLGAWAGTATTLPHDQRRRAGGTGTPMPVRSTTASGVAPGGGSAVYESTKAVDEYLLFHFADPSTLMPYAFGPQEATRFPQRCAELVRSAEYSLARERRMCCSYRSRAGEATGL